MKPVVLNGKKLAKEIEKRLKRRVFLLKKRTETIPCLAIILVGADHASEVYVKLKLAACERIGIKTKVFHLPKSAQTDEVVSTVEKLNQDTSVHGILIQHPLPKQINEEKCFRAINPSKDVDGLNPISNFYCATPLGIITLLKHYHLKILGKEAVVVGRSRILGKPMAMMLLDADATVTICHSRTKNLPQVIKRADILVAAIGKPKLIKASWIKKGAVVIDAGYNRGSVGDVDLKGVIKKCSAYTPVPGGVGPMTIVSLISQVVKATEDFSKLK